MIFYINRRHTQTFADSFFPPDDLSGGNLARPSGKIKGATLDLFA